MTAAQAKAHFAPKEGDPPTGFVGQDDVDAALDQVYADMPSSAADIGAAAASHSHVIPSWRGSPALYASSYYMSGYTNGANDSDLAEGKIVVVPVAIMPGTLDRIGAYVRTGGTTGALLRFGVYAASTTTLQPTTLIVDGGTVAAETGSAIVQVTVSAAIATPQIVWVAVVPQGGAGTIAHLPKSTNAELTHNPLLPWVPTGFSSAVTFNSLRSTAATYTGSLPANFPAFDSPSGTGLSYCGVRVTT